MDPPPPSHLKEPPPAPPAGFPPPLQKMSLRWESPETSSDSPQRSKAAARQFRLKDSLGKIAATMQSRVLAAAEDEAQERGWGPRPPGEEKGGGGEPESAEPRRMRDVIEDPETFRPEREMVGPVQHLTPEQERKKVSFLTQGLGSTVRQYMALQSLMHEAAQPPNLDETLGTRSQAQALTSIVLRPDSIRASRATTSSAEPAPASGEESYDSDDPNISELPSVLGASAYLQTLSFVEDSDDFDEFGGDTDIHTVCSSGDAHEAGVAPILAEMERTMERMELSETVDDAIDVRVGRGGQGKADAEEAIYECIKEGARELSLRGMQLTRLPALVLKASQLMDLDASYNKIDKVPRLLESLTYLHSLNLGHNEITILSESFCVPTNLRNLNLEHNHLSELPPQICLLTGLRKMSLRHNAFEELPRHLGMLEVLEELDCSRNRLSSLPRALFLIRQLRNLDLSSNFFSDLPPTINQLTNLESLDLSSNRLQILPTTLLQLGRLRKLNLRNNLIDEIPEEVKDTELQELCVAGNRLRRLPEQLCSVTSLEVLDVGRNKIGTLPSSLGQLANLRHLNAAENRLRVVPEEIGALQHLEVLALEGNRLREIPPAVAELRALKVDPSPLVQTGAPESYQPPPGSARSLISAVPTNASGRSGTPALEPEGELTTSSPSLMESYARLRGTMSSFALEPRVEAERLATTSL